jgi:flagellar motor component MotA
VRFNQYDVIVLNENFGGNPPENNEVLKFFQNMPMNTRRHIFLALVGQNLKTLDNMTAFSKSVNAVINKSDISNLANILKKSIDDNEQFYKVYKETLRRLGKR